MNILKRFGWMLVLLVSFQSGAQASDLETTAENLMIQNILKQAGVIELLYQIPDWIDQELQNLEATPVPFDAKELKVVRQDLEYNFSTPTLKKTLMAALAKEFELQELRKIHQIFKQPQIKKFHNLQEGTESEYIRADIRSYKAKLKNTTPRGSRVDMVVKLDENLKQSDIEADLKVELRKSLLTSVSWVKSNEVLEEKTLDKELASYRQRVGEEIDGKALIFYLYLFKRTPSNQLNELVTAFGEPEFLRFMKISHNVMLSSIREARSQIPENISLAEN